MANVSHRDRFVANLHRRLLVADGIHPEDAVKSSGDREKNGGGSENRARQLGPAGHDSAGSSGMRTFRDMLRRAEGGVNQSEKRGPE
jgi:hypothetical protein